MEPLPLKAEEKLDPDSEALIGQIKERARNLYLTRQLLCTESVMVSLNRGLGGGLTDAQAIAMAAPFSAAMGESGCVCGALSGAVMASGLLLGSDRPYRHRRSMRDNGRQLHDIFKAENGATCCRSLSKNVIHDRRAHFRQCAELTAHAAEIAARLILKERPELAHHADEDFLTQHHSKIGGAFLRAFRHFFPQR